MSELTLARMLRAEDVRGVVGSAYTYERIHRWLDTDRGKQGFAKCGAPLHHVFRAETASASAVSSWRLCRKCFRNSEDLAS